MSQSIQISFVVLLVVEVVSCAAAADRPRKSKPLSIKGMMMMDGGLLAGYSVEETQAVKSSSLSPEFYNLHYFWDGRHLQVHPGNADKSQWSKEEIAKDGWYVTADYSTNPPGVTLTKDPTKDSRWQFIAASKPRQMEFYIKNENDRGTDAWLDMEDTGKRYRWRQAGFFGSEIHIYKPILSVGKKKARIVIDIEEDGGK